MSLCHQVHFVARRISFGFSFGLCSMSNATNQVIRNQPRRILHLLLLHRSEFASYQRQWNCLTACFQKHLHLSLNNSCILKKKMSDINNKKHKISKMFGHYPVLRLLAQQFDALQHKVSQPHHFTHFKYGTTTTKV
jgi:hypothetical protein